MARSLIVVSAGAAVLLSGCVTSPKETVLNLDTTDRRWTSRECVAARKAVHAYDDQKDGRTVIKVLGNLAFPFAGTATALGMSRFRDDERQALNDRVVRACVSPPPKARHASKGNRPARVAGR